MPLPFHTTKKKSLLGFIPINSMSGCPGVFGILIEVGDQKCVGFGGDHSCDESGGLAMVICNVCSSIFD